MDKSAPESLNAFTVDVTRHLFAGRKYSTVGFMPAEEEDLRIVVSALARIGDNLRRAPGRAVDPTRQAILQAAATRGPVRPSEIAADLALHQSSIARQTRALEDAGFVSVAADPDDRRSCLISLTERGWGEVDAAARMGVARFGAFVADWSGEDVHTLAVLLTRLEESAASVRAKERKPGGRRWQTPAP
jgi:DNA-binding MarR family transcriptional regulator